MSLSPGVHVRRVRGAWRRAQFALGRSTRLILPLAGLAVLVGAFEAGVLAIVAQVAFAMAKGDSSTALSLGPLDVDAEVPVLLGVALVLALLRIGAQWILATLTARISATTQSRLRRKLLYAYTEGAWSVQSQDRDGHLQEMMMTHAYNATRAAMVVAGALSPIITLTILVASAVVIGPAIALAVTIAVVGVFFLLRPFGWMTRRQAKMVSGASLSLAGGVSEAVRLTEEMHVYGTAPQHRERIDELIDEVEAPFFRSQLLQLGVPTLHQGLALALVIIGLMVLHAVGAENLGSLGAIVLMLVRALAYGQQLQSAYQRLNEMAPFLDRIADEADRYASSAPVSGPEPVPALHELSFDRVSYGYNSRQSVLREVTFRVEAGETIGIVGLSGAGKSTLVQLLLRLREPDGGVYRVNSMDVRDIALTDWQRRVAFVPQEPRLLDGSVAENIRYFRSQIRSEDVEAAARMAHVHDEIRSWPGGYEHRIGQRLDAVSGGQRQRLCLARALAGHPQIMVLDEPTSALDPHSEVAIQESLEHMRGTVTMFIVAHRMSTLSTCDRIMVLESGRIEAFDTPANLQRVDGYYRATMELAGVSAKPDAP
jgi:ATP-binding cassette subfamily B protein